MIYFDMKTSIFTYILVNYVCTYVLAWTWYQSKDRPWGTGFFLVDFLFQSVGMTLACFRGTLPPLLTVVFANFLMFTGTVLFLFGMSQFLRLEVHQKRYGVYSLVFTSLYAFFTFVQPDIRMRIMLFSCMLVPVFAHIAWLVFFAADPDHRRYATNTGVTFILFALLFVGRFYYALTGDPVANYFNSPINDALLTVFSQILTILLIYSLQLMISSKLFHEVELHTIEQEALLKRTEALATFDSLTRIYNRRKMEELLSWEIERYKRYHQPFSLVLCDIDHFKRFNDTYGHDIGDKTLMAVTEILGRDIRTNDHLGRWGGEEFLIVFPGQSLQDAVQAAEKLRALVADHKPDFIANGEHITLSFGVAEFTESSDSQTILKCADRALYLAKERGRNRVEAYGKTLETFKSNCSD